MFCRLLKQHGHRTLSAYTGEAALATIGVERPDVVLLDNMMPGMNGLETLRQIRANPHTRQLPVIICSAVADLSLHTYALEKGANGYFVKASTRFSELLHMIESIEGNYTPSEF